jgi:SpoVK/Ycf46/Vps4 family AAA+-type ATPase
MLVTKAAEFSIPVKSDRNLTYLGNYIEGTKMVPIDELEEIIKAALRNDVSRLATILDKLIDKAIERNQKNVATRLRLLSRSITPATRQSRLGAQSAQSAVITAGDSQLYDLNRPDVALKDVILPLYEREKVLELIKEWDKYDMLEQHNLHPHNRLLLFGPPGTGKTRLAQAIAKELNKPLMYVRLDELISPYLGKTGKNIREIFDIGGSQDAVIFLDEIDTVAKHRDDNQELGELKRVVTVLLQNIDLLPSASIIIAATNHPGLLDTAIWRRFPFRLEMRLPISKERKDLYRYFLGPKAKKVKLDVLTALSDNLSGSDIRDIVEKALRSALINDGELDDVLMVKTMIAETFKTADTRSKRKKAYALAERLVNFGYSLQQISAMSGIPYTTLRDNIGAQS